MIVLDTHALVWWFDGDARLSKAARQAIEHELLMGGIAISAFSCWEIALLVTRKRLMLSLELSIWLAAVEAVNHLRFIPVDNRIAIASVQLPGDLHKDPADRIVAATAMQLSVPIVTADRNLRRYPYIATIW